MQNLHVIKLESFCGFRDIIRVTIILSLLVHIDVRHFIRRQYIDKICNKGVILLKFNCVLDFVKIF